MSTTRRNFFQLMLVAPLAGFFGRPIPARAAGKSCLLNRFSVAGFRFHDGPVLLRAMQPGDRITLVAEPDNPHDSFAVALHYRSRKIEYVPCSDNRHLSRMLQSNIPLRCAVLDTHPEADPWHMLQVGVWLQG